MLVFVGVWETVGVSLGKIVPVGVIEGVNVIVGVRVMVGVYVSVTGIVADGVNVSIQGIAP